MALKDEASPKYTFSGAGTSLLKSYKKLAAATEIISFLLFKSCWLLLAAAQLPLLLLLLLLLLDSLLPLLLPRPLLWLLLQLPAAKHMALRDEPSPKCAFPEAGTSLLKSYKKLAAGAFPGAGTSLLKSYKQLAAGAEMISFLTFLRAAGCC